MQKATTFVFQTGSKQIQFCRNLNFNNINFIQKKEKFEVIECAPRDGLQNLREFVPTPTKIELINRLAEDCGVKSMEGTSYSHPKMIPQLSDNSQVLSGIRKYDDVKYRLFMPSVKGLLKAINDGHAKDIVTITAGSDSLCRVNMKCTLEESLSRIKTLAKLCKEHGITHSGGIAMALGCPYEGKISPTVVAKLCEHLMEIGCDRVVLADTVGFGSPGSVNALFDEVLRVVPPEMISVHFHDTYGQALAGVLVAIERGVRIAESSIGGFGGGPFAKGAAGNLSTEDLVYMLEDLGFDTGINLEKIIETGMWLSEQIKKPNNSKTANALWKIRNDNNQKGELLAAPVFI